MKAWAPAPTVGIDAQHVAARDARRRVHEHVVADAGALGEEALQDAQRAGVAVGDEGAGRRRGGSSGSGGRASSSGAFRLGQGRGEARAVAEDDGPDVAFSSTISAPWPPSEARACTKAITSCFSARATCAPALEHGLAAGPSRCPCRARARTQRRPRRTTSRRKAASCSRASSRRRPCRSIWAWMVQPPRRSLRTTLMPISRAAERQGLVGVQQRLDVELVGDGLAQHGL